MGDRFGMNGMPRENYARQDLGVEELWANNISSGINFSKYENIKVTVDGDHHSRTVSKFTDAGLCKLLMSNVERAGYKTPTPVQKNALPIIMDGRDLMACAQTGSGKTVAFLLPIMNKIIESRIPSTLCDNGRVGPQAIIITPTRELAIQIYDEARKFSAGSDIISQVVYGGTSVNSQKYLLNRGCNILVATPGRLLDFVERGYVTFSQVMYLILDEADRMLDMGFMPDIRRCVCNPSMPAKNLRQTLMFSATFPPEIRRSAQEFLHNHLFLKVGLVGGACSDVKQTFLQASKFEKRDKLLDLLKNPSRNQRERTLVFVKTKRNADFLASLLCDEGLDTTSIHGDRLQREREEALDDFKSGRRPILVATAVAARGLDIKDVMHVVNYDMPDEVEEYVHRIGRTGRVGNTGRATSFIDVHEDHNITSPLVKVLVDAGQMVPEWLGSGKRGGY